MLFSILYRTPLTRERTFAFPLRARPGPDGLLRLLLLAGSASAGEGVPPRRRASARRSASARATAAAARAYASCTITMTCNQDDSRQLSSIQHLIQYTELAHAQTHAPT